MQGEASLPTGAPCSLLCLPIVAIASCILYQSRATRRARGDTSTQACNPRQSLCACQEEVSAVSFRRASELVHSSWDRPPQAATTCHHGNCRKPISSVLSGRASDPAHIYGVHSFRAQQGSRVSKACHSSTNGGLEALHGLRCHRGPEALFSTSVPRPPAQAQRSRAADRGSSSA